MLTITQEASEAIRGVLASESVPEGSVLRISPEPDAGLVFSITDSPAAEDQIVEGEEVEICVAPPAAEVLDDKELDATVAEGQVRFTIGEQEG